MYLEDMFFFMNKTSKAFSFLFASNKYERDYILSLNKSHIETIILVFSFIIKVTNVRIYKKNYNCGVHEYESFD